MGGWESGSGIVKASTERHGSDECRRQIERHPVLVSGNTPPCYHVLERTTKERGSLMLASSPLQLPWAPVTRV